MEFILQVTVSGVGWVVRLGPRRPGGGLPTLGQGLIGRAEWTGLGAAGLLVWEVTKMRSRAWLGQADGKKLRTLWDMRT